MKVLVAGAGGFLGGHLVARLIERGHSVRAVSRRPVKEWTQPRQWAERLQMDLRDPMACAWAAKGCDAIFNMASLVGGIAFLETRHADCMQSVVINANLLRAAVDAGCERYFFPGSACIYPDTGRADAPAIREEDAWPPDPRGGYGWEKLYSERMTLAYGARYGLKARVARIHTVYGPHSPIGENEKAPIALCRKVIEAKRSGAGNLEIWGDGEQTRSFLYVDDAVDAIVRLTASDCGEAVNLGSGRRVTINQLADAVEEVAGVKLERIYRPEAVQGVRGRVSDNTRITAATGWTETTGLDRGIEKTYRWVAQRLP